MPLSAQSSDLCGRRGGHGVGFSQGAIQNASTALAERNLKKAALPIGEAGAASEGQRQSMIDKVGGDSCSANRGDIPSLSTMPKCLVELPSPNGRARPERGSTRHLRMGEVHG